MNFHHDAAQASRLDRDWGEGYDSAGAPDWCCAIHYLTDVDENTPAFAVVPRSAPYEPLQQAFDEHPDYQELPLFGPAGTCVLYDTATYHTRLDGKDETGKVRRTMHQYYARGSWDEIDGRGPTPPLTDWNVFPKRLAASPDPDVRRFFSHWNSAPSPAPALPARHRSNRRLVFCAAAMCEWAASDWSDEVRAMMPRGYY